MNFRFQFRKKNILGSFEKIQSIIFTVYFNFRVRKENRKFIILPYKILDHLNIQTKCSMHTLITTSCHITIALRLESSNQHVFLWNDNISRSTISKPAVYLFDSFDFDSALMSRDMALFVRVIYEIARLPRNHRSRNLSAVNHDVEAEQKKKKKEREKLSIMIIAMEFLRVAKNCKQNEWLDESGIRWQRV